MYGVSYKLEVHQAFSGDSMYSATVGDYSAIADVGIGYGNLMFHAKSLSSNQLR